MIAVAIGHYPPLSAILKQTGRQATPLSAIPSPTK